MNVWAVWDAVNPAAAPLVPKGDRASPQWSVYRAVSQFADTTTLLEFEGDSDTGVWVERVDTKVSRANISPRVIGEYTLGPTMRFTASDIADMRSLHDLLYLKEKMVVAFEGTVHLAGFVQCHPFTVVLDATHASQIITLEQVFVPGLGRSGVKALNDLRAEDKTSLDQRAKDLHVPKYSIRPPSVGAVKSVVPPPAACAGSVSPWHAEANESTIITPGCEVSVTYKINGRTYSKAGYVNVTGTALQFGSVDFPWPPPTDVTILTLTQGKTTKTTANPWMLTRSGLKADDVASWAPCMVQAGDDGGMAQNHLYTLLAGPTGFAVEPDTRRLAALRVVMQWVEASAGIPDPLDHDNKARGEMLLRELQIAWAVEVKHVSEAQLRRELAAGEGQGEFAKCIARLLKPKASAPAPAPNRPTRPSVRCHKCGKMGHIGRDCRGDAPTQTPLTQRCGRCTRTGHTTAQCVAVRTPDGRPLNGMRGAPAS
jgi:hypothetical protein